MAAKALKLSSLKADLNGDDGVRHAKQCCSSGPTLSMVTEEQVSILKKYGPSASRAAKELGWSVEKTKRYSTALGIVDYKVFQLRQGRKGRPPSLRPIEKSSTTRSEGPRLKQKNNTDYCRKAGKSFIPGQQAPQIAKPLLDCKESRYMSQDAVAPSGVKAEDLKRNNKRKRGGQHRESSIEIDNLMRRYGRQLKKVANLIGWSIDAVKNRMNALGITRQSDELRIVALLHSYKGCSETVAQLTQRTRSYVQRIRNRHGIKVQTSNNGQSPAWNVYLKQVLALSASKTNKYYKLLLMSLPDTLNSTRLSYVTDISIRTLDKYRKEGWLPMQKIDFVNFLRSQVDFERQSISSRRTAQHYSPQLLDLARLTERAAIATQSPELRQEITNDAVVRILSGLGEAALIDLELPRVKKQLYPTWGLGSDSIAIKKHNDHKLAR